MADLVAAGLAGGGDVAVDLALGFGAAVAGLGAQPGDRLFAGPALGVHAGVDHQAAGAELLGLQVADLAEGVVRIQTHLVGQLFGVERPALHIGVEAPEAVDQREEVALGDVGALPDVAGDGLVIGQGGQLEARPHARVLEVDVVDRRPRAIHGAAVHVAQRGPALDVRRHALDHHGGGVGGVERLGQQRAHGGDAAVQVVDDLGAAGIVVGEDEARIVAERGHALAHRPLGEALGLEEGVDAGGDGGHLLQAHGVDLVRRLGGAGADLQQPVVVGGAVGQTPDPGFVARLGPGGPQDRDLAVQGRIDLLVGERGGAGRPVAGQAGRFGLARQGDGKARLVRGGGAEPGHLAKGGVQDEAGRDDAQADIAADPLALLVQFGGESLHPREPGLSVLRGRDRMLGVEQFGDAGEGAGLLADQVGGGALGHGRGQGVVAIDEAGAVGPQLVGIDGDVVVELALDVQTGGVEGLQRLEPVRRGGGDALGAGGGAV